MEKSTDAFHKSPIFLWLPSGHSVSGLYAALQNDTMPAHNNTEFIPNSTSMNDFSGDLTPNHDVPSGGYADDIFNNYWALSALVLVFGTAAGNILVCLAIAWERRLQNVTNYFLMSLAITDLMVAILVMPLGILTLVKGKLICSYFTF